MTSSPDLTTHYEQGEAIDRIRAELVRSGIDLDELTSGDLAGVDEFHLGGKLATNAILESLAVSAEGHHLDIGSGIGGAARAIAANTGCAVTGIDLTPAFVAAATELSEMVGLSANTTFLRADASKIEFPDAHFDTATLIHVGMNVADKPGLFAEVARVLRPGGSFHVYDIMRIADGEISFPMPWSGEPATSFLATAAEYATALEQAGFAVDEPVDRSALVAQALQLAAENPPAVNLSHLMGQNWPEMFANLRAALQAKVLAPIEIVARTS